MILYPNAKINIGLNITRKRSDGYHELESLFYPIGLKDALEFSPRKDKQVVFTNTGLNIDGDQESNLVVKAYRLLAEDYAIPGIDIHLHKRIPFGAGLGGGSSDASFMLKGLNDFFKLGLSNDQLKIYASKLGADCPFFIDNVSAVGTGIGDELYAFDLNLSGYYLVLVKPDVFVGTKEAYSNVKPQPVDTRLIDYLSNSVSSWTNNVKNDFEVSVFPQFSSIERLKRNLQESRAEYASMTGSGSAVFGLFKKRPSLVFPSTYFVWEEQL